MTVYSGSCHCLQQRLSLFFSFIALSLELVITNLVATSAAPRTAPGSALKACAAHMREVINATYSVQRRNQQQLNKGQVCYHVRHKAMRDSLSGHVLFVPASSQFWALEAHEYCVTTHMIAERSVAVQVRNTRP